MPIDAATLTTVICNAFQVKSTQDELQQLERRIRYHASFLGPDGIDEIASLLFIECDEHLRANHELEIDDVKRILSRVQKRVFRFASSGSMIPLNEKIPVAKKTNDVAIAVRTLLDGLNPKDAFILDMYYVQGMTLAEIASLNKVSVSKISRQMKTLLDKLSVQG
tara:strand:+ start:220812 stop:221306 length:495 start_codon:yes stop_codon:yes gene_type:complete